VRVRVTATLPLRHSHKNYMWFSGASAQGYKFRSRILYQSKTCYSSHVNLL